MSYALSTDYRRPYGATCRVCIPRLHYLLATQTHRDELLFACRVRCLAVVLRVTLYDLLSIYAMTPRTYVT